MWPTFNTSCHMPTCINYEVRSTAGSFTGFGVYDWNDTEAKSTVSRKIKNLTSTSLLNISHQKTGRDSALLIHKSIFLSHNSLLDISFNLGCFKVIDIQPLGAHPFPFALLAKCEYGRSIRISKYPFKSWWGSWM